jgi:hypothetical protein
MHPLVAEAMKKAAVAWLGLADAPPYPVWCLWLDDALFVVSGPGEQPAPGLAEAGEVTVTARGDHGGQIVTWPALVEPVDPASETWATVVPMLAAKRLNSAGAAKLGQKWARECVVSRLVPTDAPPVPRPEGSLAAPPRPSPAVRVTRRPFRLHKVKKPRS